MFFFSEIRCVRRNYRHQPERLMFPPKKLIFPGKRAASHTSVWKICSFNCLLPMNWNC